MKSRFTVIALAVVLALVLTAGISLAATRSAAEGGKNGRSAGDGVCSRQVAAPRGETEARFVLANHGEASQVRAERCIQECEGDCGGECLQAQEYVRQRAEGCLQGGDCGEHQRQFRKKEDKGNPSPSCGDGGASQDETLAPAGTTGGGGGACAGECTLERERACDREQDRTRLQNGNYGGCR